MNMMPTNELNINPRRAKMRYTAKAIYFRLKYSTSLISAYVVVLEDDIEFRGITDLRELHYFPRENK